MSRPTCGGSSNAPSAPRQRPRARSRRTRTLPRLPPPQQPQLRRQPLPQRHLRRTRAPSAPRPARLLSDRLWTPRPSPALGRSLSRRSLLLLAGERLAAVRADPDRPTLAGQPVLDARGLAAVRADDHHLAG